LCLLDRSKELYPNLPVIIITGFSDIKTSAIAMRQGAFDYVMKPLLPEQILLTAQEALESRKRGINNSVNYHFTDKAPKEYYFWGNSDASKKLFRLMHLVAPTDHNIIIYGEDGAGKRSIANEIHKLSKRSHMPFVLMNTTGTNKKNIAALLFGTETRTEDGSVMKAFQGKNDTKDIFEMLPQAIAVLKKNIISPFLSESLLEKYANEMPPLAR
jgi:two-component system response regulator HydG